MSNFLDPDWEQELATGPTVLKVARVGFQAGSCELGASVYEIGPGGFVSPLHAHHANEELLLVLSGRPSVRCTRAVRELAPGDVVSFPAGLTGAHQIENRSEEPARVIVVSTMRCPDVIEQLDSDKVLTITDQHDGDLLTATFRAFRSEDAVHPLDRELDTPPASAEPLA